jgi:protein-S-isoprenylcysteine O-methyltransferase Ste14
MINGKQICDYLWFAFFAGWMLAALRTKRAAQRVDWARSLTYVIPVVLGFSLMFNDRLHVAWLDTRIVPKTQELAVAAIALTVAGMAFAVWARVHLGRNWSSAPMIKQQHQLIRSGPYRLVRHPIYTGLLIALAGTFLANGKIRGALSVVVVWISFDIKRRIEEEFMVQTFGPQYEDYRRTTGALFPRIVK